MSERCRRATTRAVTALAILLASHAPALAMAPPKPGQRWALVVGRDDAAGPRLTQELKGIVRPVEAFVVDGPLDAAPAGRESRPGRSHHS